MKRILITGSTGFLGEKLVDYFESENEIFTLSNINVNSKSDRHLVVDLTNEVPDFSNSFDTIIHAAGLAHFIPKTDQEIKKFYDVNFEGTKNLVEGFSKIGNPKQFIFISTVSVYGLEIGVNITENNELNAVDPYGKSKILAEKFLSDWANKNNVILTILRPTLIFGTTAPGNLQSMEKAIRKGYYFRIGTGAVKRSSIHIDDIGPIIKKLFSISGIYNLCSDQQLTIADFENYYMRLINKKRIIVIPKKVAYLLALIGNLIELITKKEFIFNTRKYNKLTNDLSFSNSKLLYKIDHSFIEILKL